MADVSAELLAELLSKPTGPAIQARTKQPEDFTSSITISNHTAEIEVRLEDDKDAEGTALKFLIDEGQNPNEWEVTGFRKITYGAGLESVRFTYKRKANVFEREWNVDELIEELKGWHPVVKPLCEDGDHGFVVAIGDMQFGKIDGDGPKGTLERCIRAIDAAVWEFLQARERNDISHIHVAWLGDHIEGFVSQGGANTWRTTLTLNEQIRLTRRVMLYAMQAFAPLCTKLTMAAVPGNHGEPVRFEGNGITRYDDSHDTEALIAVADAAEMMPEHLGHVEFFVPQTDELIVVTEVANTVIAHHHGHKWKLHQEWTWWANQAFNVNSPMHMADVLLAGHLHHEHYEVNGSRTYWGQPALESESTWFRHTKGVGGAPAINVGVVKDGRVLTRRSIFL